MAKGGGGEEQRHRHACAACKHQGKKCDENCVLAPYFPAGKDEEFNAVHKTFGVKNLTKMLKGVPHEHRKVAADTLIWEAMAWKEDPLQGPRGLYNKVIAELNIIQPQVGSCGEHGNTNRNDVVYSQGRGFAITQTSTSFPNYPIGAGNFYNYNPNFGKDQRGKGDKSFVPSGDYTLNFVNPIQIGYEQKMGDRVRPPAANFNPNVGPYTVQNGEEIKRNELHTNYQQYPFNPNYLRYNYQDLGVQEIKYEHSTGERSRSKEYQQTDTGRRGWVAPPPGWVKINIDGSAPFGDCIGGGICRNSLGKCLFGFTIHQCHGSDELGAQFQAIIKGLLEAWNRCHSKIIIETNSLEVVYSITNGVRSQDHFMHLSKIKELLGRDWCCRVEHVGNEANLCANWLATMFAHESPGDCFFEVPPNSIVSILEKDLAGVSGAMTDGNGALRPLTIRSE